MCGTSQGNGWFHSLTAPGCKRKRNNSDATRRACHDNDNVDCVTDLYPPFAKPQWTTECDSNQSTSQGTEQCTDPMARFRSICLRSTE